MEREPNTIYTLSLSYGKDSLACLGAIEELGLPLDRIVHAEVWFNDEIPADLPPMVEFKKKADKIIKERWGIEVEHVWATKKVTDGGQENLNKKCLPKLTYEDIFYRTLKPRGGRYTIHGFPGNINMGRAQWCTGLKRDVIRKVFSSSPKTTGGINIVQYLGIASDEPERIERHEKKKGIMLPLVMANWDEAYCRKWCEERDLLSPIYTTATRGGCWFCHNQGVGQLRLLRKNYPDLWGHLMRLDLDSPTTFKSDGHTVHDYDKRFELEDKGIISADEPFKWKYLDTPPTKQMTLFDFMENDNEKQGD